MAEEPSDDGDGGVPEERAEHPESGADERSSSSPRSHTREDSEAGEESPDSAGSDLANPNRDGPTPPSEQSPPEEPPHTDPDATVDDPPEEFDTAAPSPDASPERMLPDEEDAGEGHQSTATGVQQDADVADDDVARTDGSHANSGTGNEVGVPGTGSEYDDDDFELDQPPDDEEMPLADHIEEMVNRLAVVLFFATVVTLGVFPFVENLITTMWYGLLPQQDVAAPHVYGPLELKLTELKLAGLAGLTIALPVAVYETYLFMRPGLYPHERRYYLAAVPTSLVLAVIGLAFGYFLVLPGLFTYFLYYSDVTANVAFGLRETFNLILTMMGMLAVVFQIPLCIMLAIMMGVTSRAWLAENRLYFWGAFLGVAFLFSPDPTGMAPLIVAVTMVGLYEGTLLLLRWVGR